MSEELLKGVNDNWEEMYKYAKLYYERYHNLEIPHNFKTNNGYDYDENGTISLSSWIKTQRQKISPESEKGNLLNLIGMVWHIRKRHSWEEMYKYAKLYYEKHGDLKISPRFKTNNGYDYDENGMIGLGDWVNNNRARTSPKSERGLLLSKIGMVWSVKKNKEQINTVCSENNIDVNINKVILKHISIQELISKIKFLNELNISLIHNDGRMHEIFSLSNINLIQKYGVTLESLVIKYYVPLEEKKVL